MANKIILKKSSVVAKVPVPGDLEIGELAVNLADAKLYTKDAGGTVIQLGGGSGSATPASVSDQTNTSTGFFDLPSGTTAQRPVSPVSGATRFNTTLNCVESYSTISSKWEALVYFTVPNAPTIGTATATGLTSATVTYTAPVDTGAATSTQVITSYTAVASPGGATGTVSQAGSGTITVNGLTQGQAYTFVVFATNAAGNSRQSAQQPLQGQHPRQ
jgi:hypothetical protein